MSPNLAHIPNWCPTKAHKIYVHKLRIMSEVQLWTIWSFGEWTWDVPGGCWFWDELEHWIFLKPCGSKLHCVLQFSPI
jgi:hypothetical protein